MNGTGEKKQGRPRESRVSDALLGAVLAELAAKGLDGTTVAGIAARAATSKQAIYRRYRTKTSLIGAALRRGFEAMRPAPPLRASVAEDLRRYLVNLTSVFQETQLGGAVRAVAAQHRDLEIAAVLEDADAAQRLALRQILIATPFEADMETRIDLLLGLVYFRLMFQRTSVAIDEIERAIFLVLGLVAPRDPDPLSGLPGT